MPSFDFVIYCSKHQGHLRVIEERCDTESLMHTLTVDPCSDCIEEAGAACAAGPWCYDMSKAPRDIESPSVLLLVPEQGDNAIWLGFYDGENWRGAEEGCKLKPIAWAELRLPKERP